VPEPITAAPIMTVNAALSEWRQPDLSPIARDPARAKRKKATNFGFADPNNRNGGWYQIDRSLFRRAQSRS
jgi:hypothetical protein